jgi:hypothetical protein
MLKDLHFEDMDLESVNPDILARGINNLERVKISKNNMTELQFRKIIKQMMVQTNLKMLDLRGNRDLPAICNIQTLLEKVKVDVLLDEKCEKDDTDDYNTDVSDTYVSHTDDYDIDDDDSSDGGNSNGCDDDSSDDSRWEMGDGRWQMSV